MEKELGRFGHHPNPAIDFCVEVDALEGLAVDVWVGIDTDDGQLTKRIDRAMDFRVGGDPHAIAAKQVLRRLWRDLAARTREGGK